MSRPVERGPVSPVEEWVVADSAGRRGVIPSAACCNTGGEVLPDDKPVGGRARCFVEPGAPGEPQGTPQVDKPADYSQPGAAAGQSGWPAQLRRPR
jgi:hypothetical protein